MFIYQFVPIGRPVSIPPQLGKYKCVVLVERIVDQSFRGQLSKLLVESGCLYFMAWGFDCSLWDDSVDYANLERFDYGEVPDEQFVMTTWHENQSLEEVLRFAKYDAIKSYDDRQLDDLLILDIGGEDRAEEIESMLENT